MTEPAATDPFELGAVLRERLGAVFGGRLRGLVLYGSRARGDEDPDSDFDFVVLLDEVEDVGSDLERITDVTAPLSLARDIVISALPAGASTYDESSLPFFRNVRREGVAIA